MPPTFGFNDEELKLLLVAVRHMRRTFERARQATTDAPVQDYADLYDKLFEKLLDMAGPLPDKAAELLE